MTKVKLTKIESSHSILRTPEIEGYTPTPLEVGEEFILLASPLNELDGYIRSVVTTPVVEVFQLNETLFEFKTQYSHYRLEYL